MDYNIDNNMVMESISMIALTILGCAMVWRGFFKEFWFDSDRPHILAAILAILLFMIVVMAAALLTLAWFVLTPVICLIGLLAWFRKKRIG